MEPDRMMLDSTYGPLTESPKRVAIVAAMAEELRPLVARTRVTQELRIGPMRIYRGTLGEVSVVLACTGDGRQRAEEGATALLDRFPLDLLVVVGIAGGLSPALAPGSILVARRVRDADGTDRPMSTPAPDWIERALRGNGTTAGTVVSTPDILWTAAAKAEVRARLGDDGPAVVDLESAAYARAASRAGVDYVVLRAVCDMASDGLPFDLNTCRDEAGSVRRGEVLRRAMMRPAALRSLWELQKRTTLGAERLARLAEAMLNRESA